MRKFNAFFIVLLITACTTSLGTDTPAAPTNRSGFQSAGITQPAIVFTPTVTKTPSIDTSSTAEATSTPLPRLADSVPIKLTSLHMLDPKSGWGIEESGHIVRTRDGGGTWQDVTPLQGLYDDNGFFALDADIAWATPKPPDACDATQMVWSEYQQCLPGPDVIIWRTVDGGQTWQASSSRGMESENYRPTSIQFIDARTGWFLYVSRLGPMGFTIMDMLKTEDGGASWASTLSPQGACVHRTLVFIDARNGWSGADCRFVPVDWLPLQDFINGKFSFELYHTSDGARSNWDSEVLPSPQIFPEQLTASDANPNFVILCGVTGMEWISAEAFTALWTCSINRSASPETDFYYQFLTSDRGQSWHSWLATGNEFFLNAQVGWRLYTPTSAQFSQFQQTFDSGKSWTTIKNVAWQSAQFDFVNEMEGWAIAGNGNTVSLLHTADGGKTWEEIRPVIVNP